MGGSVQFRVEYQVFWSRSSLPRVGLLAGQHDGAQRLLDPVLGSILLPCRGGALVYSTEKEAWLEEMVERYVRDWLAEQG